MSKYVYMSKEDFNFLVERSLELAEFHHEDIRDAAKAAKDIPEWATHFHGPCDWDNEGQFEEIKK